MSFLDNLFSSKDDKNFKDIEDLINQSNTVTLDSDIIFSRSDKRKYGLDGIKITGDDLTIDGNGYTIDGKEKTTVFTVSGNNITLKNINFRNAKSAIVNNGSLNLINCTFEDNISNKGNDRDILNENKMVLNNNHFKNETKTILNKGIIFLEESSKDPIHSITNEGEIYRRKPIEDDQHDFDYLKDLIENADGEIMLDRDIIFNIFSQKDNAAIPIRKDNIILNGNGHVIDLKNKSQGIFDVKSDNVIIKNFIFKNSPVKTISNEGFNLQLINCYFKNGDSESHGAIFNRGGMYILNSRFKNNFSQKSGAAVCNEGVMQISNSNFINNNSIHSGGAIQNTGEIFITNSTFTDNTSKKSGSVLSNEGKVKFGSCRFINNSSDDSGSTIADFNGIIEFFDSTFSYNHQPNAVIFTCPDSHIELNRCSILDNMCEFSIINNHCVLKLDQCEMKNNIAKCIIYNAENIIHHQIEEKSYLDIREVEFADNRADISVIYNNDKCCEIRNSQFSNNTSNEGDYANIHNSGEIKLTGSIFSDDTVSVINEGAIFLDKGDDKTKDVIDNQGSIEYNE